MWNSYLETKSKENNITHISIINELLNEDGTITAESYCIIRNGGLESLDI